MSLHKLFLSPPIVKCIGNNWRLLSTIGSSRFVDNITSQFAGLNVSEKSPPKITEYLFSPRTITNNIEIGQIRPSIKEIPLRPSLNQIINEIKTPMIDNLTNNNPFDCPTISNIPEKHAVRAIVIKRHKMRVHKLKKLRRRMKYVFMRIQQNRRVKKEKAFQAMLLAKLKDAEKFSPEAYITERLQLANVKPLPKRWKGKRLPEFIIRQLMGLDPKINYKQF